MRKLTPNSLFLVFWKSEEKREKQKILYQFELNNSFDLKKKLNSLFLLILNNATKQSNTRAYHTAMNPA